MGVCNEDIKKTNQIRRVDERIDNSTAGQHRKKISTNVLLLFASLNGFMGYEMCKP